MAVPSKLIFYKSNDQVVEVSGLADGITGDYISSATLTASLYDRAGTVVPGLNAIPLVCTDPATGTYRGQVEETFNPTKGGGYTLKIDAEDGTTVLHLEIPVEIRVRKQ